MTEAQISIESKTGEVGTCQICGRLIGAKRGRIAHHGYQRPHNWHSQTASCMGAKHLPFEVSRERLGDLLKLLESDIITYRAQIEAIERNETSLELSAPTAWDRARHMHRWTPTTAATFAAVFEQHRPHLHMYSIYTWDKLRA